MKPAAGSRLYYYGEIGVKGVLTNEILADKITVMSNRLIFRRAKDLVDVYALAHCTEVRTSEIMQITDSSPDRMLGSFDEFCSRRQDLRHAYDKLERIAGKPPFSSVYAYLEKFIEPFAVQEKAPLIWNSTESRWKPDLMKDIETTKEVSAGRTAAEPGTFKSVLAQAENFKKTQKENPPAAAGKKLYKNDPEL